MIYLQRKKNGSQFLLKAPNKYKITTTIIFKKIKSIQGWLICIKINLRIEMYFLNHLIVFRFTFLLNNNTFTLIM